MQKSSQWAVNENQQKKYPYDDIETYLTEPVLPQNAIIAAGGYLSYWTTASKKVRPFLAQMALDFISAPGKLFYK